MPDQDFVTPDPTDQGPPVIGSIQSILSSALGGDQGETYTPSARPQVFNPTPAPSGFDSYRDTIWDAAQQNGLDPRVLSGVLSQESNFNPNAVGDNGRSFGMGQLNVRGALVDLGLSPQQAMDPDTGIRAAAKFLRKKIDSANGNIWEGVKRYNGGGDPHYVEHVQGKMSKLFGGVLNAVIPAAQAEETITARQPESAQSSIAAILKQALGKSEEQPDTGQVPVAPIAPVTARDSIAAIVGPVFKAQDQSSATVTNQQPQSQGLTIDVPYTSTEAAKGTQAAVPPAKPGLWDYFTQALAHPTTAGPEQPEANIASTGQPLGIGKGIQAASYSAVAQLERVGANIIASLRKNLQLPPNVADSPAFKRMQANADAILGGLPNLPEELQAKWSQQAEEDQNIANSIMADNPGFSANISYGIANGVFSAPAMIGAWALGGPQGLAALGAIEHAHEGPAEAAKAAAFNHVFGVVGEKLAALGRLYGSLGMGGMGAGVSAVQGGTPAQIVAGGVSGAALGATVGGEQRRAPEPGKLTPTPSPIETAEQAPITLEMPTGAGTAQAAPGEATEPAYQPQPQGSPFVSEAPPPAPPSPAMPPTPPGGEFAGAGEAPTPAPTPAPVPAAAEVPPAPLWAQRSAAKAAQEIQTAQRRLDSPQLSDAGKQTYTDQINWQKDYIGRLAEQYPALTEKYGDLIPPKEAQPLPKAVPPSPPLVTGEPVASIPETPAPGQDALSTLLRRPAAFVRTPEPGLAPQAAGNDALAHVMQRGNDLSQALSEAAANKPVTLPEVTRNAPEIRQEPERGQPEYQGTGGIGTPAETGGGYRAVEGGQVQPETAAQETLKPVPTQAELMAEDLANRITTYQDQVTQGGLTPLVERRAQRGLDDSRATLETLIKNNKGLEDYQKYLETPEAPSIPKPGDAKVPEAQARIADNLSDAIYANTRKLATADLTPLDTLRTQRAVDAARAHLQELLDNYPTLEPTYGKYVQGEKSHVETAAEAEKPVITATEPGEPEMAGAEPTVIPTGAKQPETIKAEPGVTAKLAPSEQPERTQPATTKETGAGLEQPTPSARKINPKEVNENDSILSAIAKLGGIDRAEAERQGVDPANFPTRGYGIKRVFTRTGKSFDSMAESLHELGYPVANDRGQYDPNILLDKIDGELRGEKVYTAAGAETQARSAAEELERYRGEGNWFEDPTVLEGEEPFSARVLELSAAADHIEGGAAERILETAAKQELTDEQTAELLENFINANTQRETTVEQVPPAEKTGEAQPEARREELLRPYTEEELTARETQSRETDRTRVEQERLAAQKEAADRERGQFELAPQGASAEHNVLSARVQDMFGTRRPEPGVKPSTPPGINPLTGEAELGAGISPKAFAKALPRNITRDEARQPGGILDSLKKVFTPEGRGPIAKQAAGIFRHRLAEMRANILRASNRLEGYAAAADTLTKEQKYEFIDKFEHGVKQATTGMDDAANLLDTINKEHEIELAKLDPESVKNFVEHYLGRIWKDKDKFAAYLGKRPLEGSKNFLKARVHEFFTDGINAGLEPVTDNPFDMQMMKLKEIERYIMGQKVFREFKESGLAQRFVNSRDVPEGWTKLNDKIAHIMQYSEEAGGFVARGDYYAPDEAATIFNNYLSKGLAGRSLGNLFTLWRVAGNMMQQAQLGISGFHLGFEIMDTTANQASVAAEHAVRGDYVKAAKALGKAPTAIGSYWKAGRDLERAMVDGTNDPVMHDLADAFLQGGGNIAQDPFYRNVESGELRRAILQKKPITAVLKAPGAAMDLISKPIFQYLVPRVKMGAFREQAQAALERNPDMSLAERRKVFGEIWDNVEYRLGQMTYDNRFLNNSLKDALMASIRSVGWNWGDIAILGKGLKDPFIEKKLTNATAYLFTMAATTAVYGAMYQYLMTGKAPESAKDLYYPRNGKIKDGEEQRSALPTYMKDYLAWYNQGLLKTATHKVHPLVSTLYDAWTNRTFYDEAIRVPGDPLWKDAANTMIFLGEQMLPFSYTGARERQGLEWADKSPAEKVKAFLTDPAMIGITPAPAYVTHTPERNIEIGKFAERDAVERKAFSQFKAGNRAEALATLRSVAPRKNTADYIRHTLRRFSLKQARSTVTSE